MPLVVFVQQVEERGRAREMVGNIPYQTPRPQSHADARSVFSPISTIRTICGHPATALLCMNERGGRRTSQAWMRSEQDSHSYPVKRKRSLRLHGALQRPHPRYRRLSTACERHGEIAAVTYHSGIARMLSWHVNRDPVRQSRYEC